MRSVRSAATAAAAALCVAAAAGAQQPDAYARGLDLEQAEKYREAAAAYRQAISAEPAHLAALLGLERVYAQLGWTDSLLPVLDAAIALRPSESGLRAMQFRALHSLGDAGRLRAAFERWRQDAPGDVGPYRELAKLLLQDGQTQAADSLLRRAQADLGSARGLEMEMAQLRAGLGQWDRSAESWRAAVESAPYLEQAAVFALTPAPAAMRDRVRQALLAPPPSVGARRIAAALEIGWGSPRAGWEAVRALRADSAGLAAWLDFARRAEEAQAWLVARDALAAVLARTRTADVALRAASAAMNGGDWRSALTLAGAVRDDSAAALAALPVRLRALAALGQPQAAQEALAQARERVGHAQYARLARLVAWGWIRSGDVARARALLGGGTGDDPVSGWIALYEGDLRTARRLLKSQPDATPELVAALALLARARADNAVAAGRAFLALARGDTAAAAAAFEEAARALPEAAPLLQLTAARLYAARLDDVRAAALWSAVLERHPDSPEAPEADLEWARALRRAGRPAAAAERLEHLILTYPQSALVPQARRELEAVRASVPPAA